MISIEIRKKLIELINSQTSIINDIQSFKQYINKCRREQINNEETIVQPFAIIFLRLLNYINQHNLVIEEEQKSNKPDFYTDKFILECKSSKYQDFSISMGREESPKDQLKRYLKTKNFGRDYGILFSFDRLEVYKLVDDNIVKLDDLSFSLLDVYENISINFDNFINTFYVSPLSTLDKINFIAEVKKTDLGPIRPKIFNNISKSLIREISVELNSQFISLDKKGDVKQLLTAKICQIKKQMDLSSTEEAEKEFLSQMSYIILARILLTKCWEDLGLIEPPTTYNGGLKKYISDFHEKIEEVYKKALGKSQDIYYLFNPDNPYLLLKISEELIVDIFFQTCKFNFETLNYDILGYIYEDYLDLENRKNFGQYYTPAFIVNLILDRVGYVPQRNKLLDATILDPASGSGTFLLSAVQRILHSKKDGGDHSLEYKEIIENNVYGSELMLFPYLLSEINILIQISQELKKIIEKNHNLNVFHVFPNNSFNLIDKTILTRIFSLPEEDIKGNSIVDSAVIDRKREKLLYLQKKIDFDFVIGNPPYVANNRNPELFREMQELFTFCSTTYRNKMDLFYWFIILGILKLKSGGKLSFITTRYWIDKGKLTGVETLKKFILDYCYIREIIDLRRVNVFTSAPGQDNIIFILEKKGSQNSDDLIKIFRILPRPEKVECKLKCELLRDYCKNDQEYLQCLCSKSLEWDDLLTNKNHELNNYINGFKSIRKTEDLEPNRSWDIFIPSVGIIKDVLNEIVNSCKNEIKIKEVTGRIHVEKDVIKHIKDFFDIRVGILTTIDNVFVLTPDKLKIKEKNYFIKIDSSIKMKVSEKRQTIEFYGGEIDREGFVWLKVSKKEEKRLLDYYKTPSVYRHGLDSSKIAGKLIFFETEKEYNICPVLVFYLLQFKENIESTLKGFAQSEYNPRRPNKWITLRRGGIVKINKEDRNLYEYYINQPKIFYNYRVGNDNIFGFTNKQMCATTDMYFFHKKNNNINIFYILAYLNSKIMTFYFKERPIELQRQKTNVENDIPIFIPRNKKEILLRDLIIKKERQLIRKLRVLEKNFRQNGFHFNIESGTEENIKVNLQEFLRNIKQDTIDTISYKVERDTNLDSIDRKIFPILIKNPNKIEKIGAFTEIVGENDVIFKSKSLEITVLNKYYEKFKMAIESYFNFSEHPMYSDLLNLKIPRKELINRLNVLFDTLSNIITQLSIPDKNKIEYIVENVYNLENSSGIENIKTVSQIIYFIDMVLVKMMIPKYKDIIINY